MVGKNNKTLYFTRGSYVPYGSRQHILMLCNHKGSIENIIRAPWGIWWRPFRKRHYYKKILDVGCWWPTLFHDVIKYCRSYDACQRVGGLAIQRLAKLVIILLEEPFMKWGFNFVVLIKHVGRFTSNKDIIVTTYYATKWVEAKVFRTNIMTVITKILYEYILTMFACPLTLITNQIVHFINDVIKYLTNHFLLKHVCSTTYSP
jgi:hypothetical protein